MGPDDEAGGSENEAGGRLRTGVLWMESGYSSITDFVSVSNSFSGETSGAYIEVEPSARPIPIRESEVEVRIDGPGEKTDESETSGDRGEKTNGGEEVGSESEPAALNSGVEGREPEVETPTKVCVSVEEVGLGLESIRGCG